MKIRPVGAECSMRTDGRTYGRTDRQTDMTELLVAFQNFANALKNVHILSAEVVFHKRHYARNPVVSRKNFPERCFAHHAVITAPNPIVGRGVTMMNDYELNLFLVTARRLTVWVGCQLVLPQRLSSLSVTVLWASVEEPVTVGYSV